MKWFAFYLLFLVVLSDTANGQQVCRDGACESAGVARMVAELRHIRTTRPVEIVWPCVDRNTLYISDGCGNYGHNPYHRPIYYDNGPAFAVSLGFRPVYPGPGFCRPVYSQQCAPVWIWERR